MNWVETLIAWAVSLQALEQILLQRRLHDGDPWQTTWMSGPLFSATQWLRFFVAIACLVYSWLPAFLILFLTTYLVSVRYRGTFNGGSDTVTLHVLGAVIVAQAFPQFKSEAQFYIVLFVALSYFVAGLAKLLTPVWRDGSALTQFLLFSNAAFPNRFTESVRRNPNRVRKWAWFVTLWECLFPIGLLLPSTMGVFLSVGVLFHLLNFYFFGLNRFFWAWLAAYPAFFGMISQRF